ncbi:PaaI family thioesterase [Mycolicibacterium porcinum]|uniref:PaaI family thioesterase n=1 Tax=Mycolicibacterium porcinum TaxID=39693 RepID=A0AAW5T0W0_9MYCO|nr:PaaI family thioesterase [Mycolicibacterium porcinum]MCV7388173.1 PaaI family thioesterase [Mycolicibacterium porcinum]ORB43321.1 phenylacetic acid degradation protein [Mycolicibacterium porcinum]CDO31142.1 phenylacetic acid degradation-like protein [Mycolicibacterium vulneris]
MTGVDDRITEYDLETPDSIQVRFGIECLASDENEATVTFSMPMNRFRNPVTGVPTIGPLAVLVDAAGGMVNHYRRPNGQWTVSSELSVEISPDDTGDLDGPVIASARTLGSTGATSLSICTLTYRGTIIGGGTVRSFFIPADGVLIKRPPETLRRSAETTLSDLMALEVRPKADGQVPLGQLVDPNLNNDIGIVHGGVAAAGLELAASAAINSPDGGLRTGSLRVNFLRPFFAGAQSRYVGAPLRVGRNTGVGDAQAIGDDGKVAITARVTAYR